MTSFADIRPPDWDALTMRYVEVTQPDGSTMKVGYPDHEKRRALERKLKAQGTALLDDFVNWQVVDRGLEYKKARRGAGLVWMLLMHGGGDPVAILRRRQLAAVRRYELRGALSRFCSWILQDEDASLADQQWAKRIILDVARTVPRSRTAKARTGDVMSLAHRYVPDEVRSPLTLLPEHIDRLILAAEEYHQEDGYRRPWARPILRIWLQTGVPYTFLRFLTYERTADALRRFDAADPTAAVQIWCRAKSSRYRQPSRLIPVALIEPELRVLHNWSMPWSTLTDIASGPIVTQAEKEVVRRSGVVPPETTLYAWRRAIHLAAIRRLFRLTGDILLCQHVSGMRVSALDAVFALAGL